jgi:siroheme synthase (precorrin-2 oxidase/ferrochelatase)
MPSESKPLVHEMAVGNDMVNKKVVDMATDVRNLVNKADSATFTQNVVLIDTNTNTC